MATSHEVKDHEETLMVKKGHYDGWLKDDKLNEEIKSEFKSGGSILISGTKEAFQKFV